MKQVKFHLISRRGVGGKYPPSGAPFVALLRTPMPFTADDVLPGGVVVLFQLADSLTTATHVFDLNVHSDVIYGTCL